MRKAPQFLLRSLVVALAPVAANAAGTYYPGGYQSPQTARYNNANGGYSQYSTYSRTTTAGYTPVNTQGTGAARAQAQQPQAQPRTASTAKQSGQSGFYVGAGLSREYAMWQFEMANNGSILRWDNLAWNVLDIKGGYVFDAGNTKLEIGAGFKYGFQAGDSYMLDDDITNGGYRIAEICNGGHVNEDGTCVDTLGYQVGHAMSVGSVKDSNMMDFHVGFGLTDLFSWGNVRFTPSLGYRYLKYKLNTKTNYGLAVDTGKCYVFPDGEMQCPPIITFYPTGGIPAVDWDDPVNDDGDKNFPAGGGMYNTEGTFYFEQPGTSHSYETTWSGPFIAMDMAYDINKNNAVTGRVELGFPGYTAIGDQPYRPDWAHPKSVEDEAGMFSALHLGLGANWMTALTDTIMLTVGLTYDYYTVSGADATTYLNGAYYTEMREQTVKKADEATDEYRKNAYLSLVDALDQLQAECPGWTCKEGGEVDSFYRSLGIRVGINTKF